MRNLSQRQLAARMGVPRTYISKIENGKAVPHPVFSRSPRPSPSGRHLHPSARLQHPPSRRDRSPHDRSLPRRNRHVHLAARRPAALHLPQPRSRARRRSSSYSLSGVSAASTNLSLPESAHLPRWTLSLRLGIGFTESFVNFLFSKSAPAMMAPFVPQTTYGMSRRHHARQKTIC
ncbi:MAG: helix-turn-helix transcriptional regulator [Edaphobacter sp.]